MVSRISAADWAAVGRGLRKVADELAIQVLKEAKSSPAAMLMRHVQAQACQEQVQTPAQTPESASSAAHTISNSVPADISSIVSQALSFAGSLNANASTTPSSNFNTAHPTLGSHAKPTPIPVSLPDTAHAQQSTGNATTAHVSAVPGQSSPPEMSTPPTPAASLPASKPDSPVLLPQSTVAAPSATAQSAEAANPALPSTARERSVPASRLSRVAHFGSLGVGLGLGLLGELGRRAVGAGSGGSAFLTAGNVQRVVATLCRVRGAALKLGQIVSMQEDMLPPQLLELFERVRQSADFMPRPQMAGVMESALVAKQAGADWATMFAEFEEKPFAAASIGQVHRARLHDGTVVAVKVQYPGVADSIESDIANLQTLLSVTGLLPKDSIGRAPDSTGLFVDQLMDVARDELAMECNYSNEAAAMQRFRRLLASDPAFVVPRVILSHSTPRVLTSTLEQGITIEQTFGMSQAVRDRIAERMLRLCLRELFEFRYMQTDPNWANFLYDAASDRVCLLDFGASRSFADSFVSDYAEVIQAAVQEATASHTAAQALSATGDRERCVHFSQRLGFLDGKESAVMRDAHVKAVFLLARPFAHPGQYDFSDQSVTQQVRKLVPVMLAHRTTPPPRETYSLHRKARIECGPMFQAMYNLRQSEAPVPP